MKAEEELQQLGPRAEAALHQGLNDPDAQVRDLSRQILGKIRQAGRDARLLEFLEDKDDRLTPPLPGWKRFSALTGNGPSQRKRFLELYRHAEATLEEIDRDPRKAATLVSPWTTAARTALLTSSKEQEVLRELLILLFLVSDGRVPVGANEFNRVGSVLTILAERSAIAKSFREDPLLRRLTWDFLRERSPAPPLQTATVALALELPEARDWAVQTALDRDQAILVRSWALLLASKVGGKEVSARLEPLLGESTSVGTFNLGNTKLTTELRDVALAAVVQARGGQVAVYGFPYLHAVPGLKSLPSPDRLGFADAASRQAAFQRWKDSSRDR